MIGKGVFRSSDKGGETFSVACPEVAIPAGEYIAIPHGFTILSRIMNSKRFKIGAVREEDARIHRAERMDRLRRNCETEVCQARLGDINVGNGQDKMIDGIRVQLNGLRRWEIHRARKARRG